MVTELIIAIVYWAVLYKEDFAKVHREKDPLRAQYMWWHKFLMHFVPAVCAVAHTLITRGVLIPGHAVYMIFTGVAYMPFNYIGTMAKGQPLYFFMPWHDYKTVLAGLVVFCIAACIQ